MTFYTNDFRVGMTAGQYRGGSSSGYPGYHDNLSAGQEETINPMALGLMVTPSDAGETVTIESTSAGDVGFIIILEVLDDSGLSTLGLAVTNGTNPVIVRTTALQPLLVSRVNSVINRTSSRVQTAGDILCKNLAGDITYSGFKASDQRSFCLLFTTPSDKMGWFLPSESTINKSGGSDATVILRTKTRIKNGPWINNGRWGLHESGTSAFLFETYDQPYIPPFTDIMITAEASSNNTDVTGRVPIYTAPKEYYKG